MGNNKLELRVEELLKDYKMHNDRLEEKKSKMSYTDQYLLGEDEDFIEVSKIEKEFEQILKYIDRKVSELQEEKEELEKKLEDKKDNLNYTELFLAGEDLNEIESRKMKIDSLNKMKKHIEDKEIQIKVDNKKDNSIKKIVNDNKTNSSRNKERIESKLDIIYNRTSNTYTIIDREADYQSVHELDKTLLSKKKRNDFVDELEYKYGKNFEYAIEDMVDINLYNCLKEYDKKMGTNEADKYINDLDSEGGTSNFNIIYNLRGKRGLDILNNMRLNNIAKENEKNGFAKVEQNTLKEKMGYAWRKFRGLFAVGLVAGTAAVVALPDAQKNTNEKDIAFSANAGKSSKSETLQDRVKVGTTVKNVKGTYHSNSEETGRTGEFENHGDENLEVDKFAIVDKKTGKFVRYATAEETNDIEKVDIGKYDVKVHISHAKDANCPTTKGGSLGWTDIDNVKTMEDDGEVR